MVDSEMCLSTQYAIRITSCHQVLATDRQSIISDTR